MHFEQNKSLAQCKACNAFDAKLRVSMQSATAAAHSELPHRVVPHSRWEGFCETKYGLRMRLTLRHCSYS